MDTGFSRDTMPGVYFRPGMESAAYDNAVAMCEARNTLRPEPIPLHMYWCGTKIGRMQTIGLKSLLLTQRSYKNEIHLWLDEREGYPSHKGSYALAPILPMIHVHPISDRMTQGTPFEGVRRQFADRKLAARSDMIRFFLMWKFGGIYLDMDNIILKDLGALTHGPEFCYSWGHMPWATSAVMMLDKDSPTNRHALEKILRLGNAHPSNLLNYNDTGFSGWHAYPSSLFDPLWMQIVHGKGGHGMRGFVDFLESPVYFGGTPEVSLETFYPHAFGYSFHGIWNHPSIASDSYFAQLEGEINRGLGI